MKAISLSFYFMMLLGVLSAGVWTAFTNNDNANQCIETIDSYWVATSNGIVRYHKDSGQKTHFNVVNTVFGEMSKLWIYQASDGTIWTGDDYALYRFNSNTWERFDLNVPDSVSRVESAFCMTEDNLGNLWVGGNNWFAMINSMGSSIISASEGGLPQGWISSIAVDSANQVWLGICYEDHDGYYHSARTTLSKYHQGSFTNMILHQGNHVSLIFKISPIGADSLWMHWGNRIHHYENGAITEDYGYQEMGLIAGGWPRMVMTNPNEMWIAFPSGLVRYLDGVFAVYENAMLPLEGATITGLDVGMNGDLLFSTIGKAVGVYDGGEMELLSLSNAPLANSWINEMVSSPDGSMWVLQHYKQLRYHNGEWFEPPYPFESFIRNICVDPSGLLWVSLAGIIASWDGTDWTVYHTADFGYGLFYSRFMKADYSGNIWIATQDSVAPGLYRFDGQSIIKYDTTNYLMTYDTIMGLEVDAMNRVLLSTGMQGFYRITNSTSWQNLGTPYSSNDFCDSFCTDSNSEIWAIWERAFLQHYITSWYRFVPDGAVANYLRVVCSDALDRVWVLDSRDKLYSIESGSSTLHQTPGLSRISSFTAFLRSDSNARIWITRHLKAVILVYDADGTAIEDPHAIPELPDMRVSNYPNPFIGSTTISFKTERGGIHCLDVFNLRGQKVYSHRTEYLPGATHSIVWNAVDSSGKALPLGVYLIKITGSEGHKVHKVLLKP
jgi:ligand-binding sensor domain-containing protein